MGSKHKYTNFAPSRIDAQIDGILLGTIRSLIVVFFLVVTLISFLFATLLTLVCLFACTLHLMVRLVAQRQETQRMFALAGY